LSAVLYAFRALPVCWEWWGVRVREACLVVGSVACGADVQGVVVYVCVFIAVFAGAVRLSIGGGDVGGVAVLA
jgi:hypothetical protein